MFKKLRQVFGGDDSDSDGEQGQLKDVRFKEKYEELKGKSHPELRILMLRLGAGEEGLTAGELMRFLRTIQKEKSVTNGDCVKLIAEHEATAGHSGSKNLSVEGLHALLLSARELVFNPKHTTVNQDMTQPLSDYYIGSSHNTYLSGHQLKGEASTEAYVRALDLGTRLVELDCFDGSDGEPEIYHGKTLTSSVKFSAVIKALKEHSFKTSPYPVIMSFENHCSLEQQAVMARILQEILGDQLCKSLASNDKLLPSPEELKHKFLVKGKKCRPEVEAQCASDEGEDQSDDEEDEEEEEEGDAAKEEPAAASGASQASGGKSKKEAKPKVMIAVALSRVTALQSVHFTSFEAPKQKPWQMTSIPEKISLGYSESDDCIKWVDYNKKFLSKVYPYGLRFGSSNMEPMVPWLCGAQIAALNYQTDTDPMTVNQAWFARNGQCGYVLKPAFMRDAKSQFDLRSVRGQALAPVTLKIRFLNGINLPQTGQMSDIIDPFVLVEIMGVPDDQESKKTKVISNTQYPVWDEQLEFSVTCPELAVAELRVYDKDTVGKDFLGQYFIRVDSLQSGYRYIQLEDQAREPVKGAYLFVQISLERQAAGASK